MKRLFIFAAAALLCLSMTFAQEKSSYRQKIEILMTEDGDIAELENKIRESLQSNLSAEAMENDSLRPMIEYLQNGLLNDLMDSYEASAHKYLTEDELDELIAWTQKPQSKAVKAKEKALAERMQSQDPEMLVHVGTLMNGMAAVLQGQKPEKLPNSHQNKAYQKAFHEYYAASNAGETLRQTFDGVLSSFGQYLQSDPKGAKTLKAASDYMVNNLESLLLLLYEDTYTEEDLRYYTEFCKTSTYQHLSQAQSDFAGSLGQLMLKILGSLNQNNN